MTDVAGQTDGPTPQSTGPAQETAQAGYFALSALRRQMIPNLCCCGRAESGVPFFGIATARSAAMRWAPPKAMMFEVAYARFRSRPNDCQ